MQIKIVCDVMPGGYFIDGLYEILFNDYDYIFLNEDLSTWTAFGRAAEILAQEWRNTDEAQTVRNFLQGPCKELLLDQLGYGKEVLLRTDIPKTHVTHKIRADRNITLRCWAMNFYSADITLTWQRDGNNKTLDMEVIETRPSGDGTFQKWAAVVVPSGEEQRYTCYVNHQGLPEPITVRWEPLPQPSVPIMAIVTGLIIGAVLTGAVVTFLIWKKKTKRISSSAGKEECHNPGDYLAQVSLSGILGSGAKASQEAKASQRFPLPCFYYDSEGCVNETMKTFLNGECVQLLHAHLNYGKEIFLKTDTPKTHVTHKVRADGNITLRCWAMNFYPDEITMMWQRDGSKKALDMNVIETRPSGDGTFQKWAAVVVTSGEEQRYTCHVNHQGLPEPIIVKWEPPQPSVPIMAIVTSLVLGAVLTGAVVTFLIWKRRTMDKNPGSYSERNVEEGSQLTVQSQISCASEVANILGKPRAMWLESLRPWKPQTTKHRSQCRASRDSLFSLEECSHSLVTGYHTMHILTTCDVLPGGNFIHEIFELIFNGHDYLTPNEDLSTWTAVGKVAEILIQALDQSGLARTVKSFLEGECVQFLLQKLHHGKEILLRTELYLPHQPLSHPSKTRRWNLPEVGSCGGTASEELEDPAFRPGALGAASGDNLSTLIPVLFPLTTSF
ncbi:H-2 class I histocompatibility antigen, Q10 alpha chain-like [Sigmodon hispidus]